MTDGNSWHQAAEELEKSPDIRYKFSDYKVKIENIKPDKNPILNRYPQESAGFKKAQKFSRYRSIINDGLSKGVNFAGHFSFITWGCGTECVEAVIVNVKTGKIYGYLNSHFGFAFKENSRLLVADVWASEDTKILYPEVERSYWLWDGKTLKKLRN
ncbi:MAG: hypothetical protein AABY33_07365 [Pseudomonadota bacterium]